MYTVIQHVNPEVKGTINAIEGLHRNNPEKLITSLLDKVREDRKDDNDDYLWAALKDFEHIGGLEISFPERLSEPGQRQKRELLFDLWNKICGTAERTIPGLMGRLSANWPSFGGILVMLYNLTTIIDRIRELEGKLHDADTKRVEDTHKWKARVYQKMIDTFTQLKKSEQISAEETKCFRDAHSDEFPAFERAMLQAYKNSFFNVRSVKDGSKECTGNATAVVGGTALPERIAYREHKVEIKLIVERLSQSDSRIDEAITAEEHVEQIARAAKAKWLGFHKAIRSNGGYQQLEGRQTPTAIVAHDDFCVKVKVIVVLLQAKEIRQRNQ